MTCKSGLADNSKKKMDTYAYETVRAMILDGSLAPGQAIVEQSLSEKLDISRTPVRSALRQLAAERLVEIMPDKGSFVTNVSIDDANEIFEFRILLEKESLKHYITKVSDSELDEYISKFRGFGDMKLFRGEYHDLDEQFHMDIVKSSGNSRIIETYSQLLTQQMRYRIIASRDPNRIKSTAGEHIEILQRIKARDYKLAVQALSRHLLNVRDSIWLSLNSFYYTDD